MNTPAQPSPPDLRQETEWQFDAVHTGPVLQWLRRQPFAPVAEIEERAERELRDLYLDTEDWRMFGAGYALRIRDRGGAFVATLKSLEGGDDDVRRRIEIEETLPDGSAESLLASGGAVGSRARAVAGKRALRPFLTLSTRRRSLRLRSGQAGDAEIALDETAIALDSERTPAHLSRVEVEVTSGDPDALRPLVQTLQRECSLRPTRVSKLETGLIALGIQPGTDLDLGPEEIGRVASIAELAFAVFRTQLGRVLDHEPGTRLGDDIEELHDMRVATRRLRAAIRLFRPYLPARFDRINSELRWLGAILGDVRDLDVQIEQMEEWSRAAENLVPEGMDQLTRSLRERRTLARKRMLRALDTKRYRRLVDGFAGLLRRGASRRSKAGRTPALAVAPDLVEKAYRKVRKLGDRIGADSPADRYHALRIRCKRLRYALEFTRQLYGKPARRYVRRLVRLQDLLGLHQDSTVAIDHFRDLLHEERRELDHRAYFNLGQLTEHHAIRADRLRQAFPETYAKVTGKAWKTLKTVMEAQRPFARDEEPRAGAADEPVPSRVDGDPGGRSPQPEGAED